MANLYVTYATTRPKRYGSYSGSLPQLGLEKGSDCRTEPIALGAVSETGLLEASESDQVVSIYAEAAAWFVIGDDDTTTLTASEPESEGVTTSRYIAAGERLQYLVLPGEKVAAVSAA